MQAETSGSQGGSQENQYKYCVNSALCQHCDFIRVGNRPKKTTPPRPYFAAYLKCSKHVTLFGHALLW